MADMLGPDRLTSSYGISLCVNGILQLIGPPICLTIFEIIRGYRPIFFVLGIFLLIGTSLWSFMPCVTRRKKEREALAIAQERTA
jgi:MFS family permease